MGGKLVWFSLGSILTSVISNHSDTKSVYYDESIKIIPNYFTPF